MSAGNDRYRQAINLQTRQYQLSMDGEPTNPETSQETIMPSPSADGGLRVSMRLYLTAKYLDNDEQRATLGALELMAGYQV